METLAAKPRPLSWKDREVVGLVGFSHALQHMYVAVLPLVYPLAVDEFHISYTVLGTMLAIVGVVGGLLQGAAGFYHRVSARLVLVWQNVLLAATAVLIGLAPNFPVFGAGRFVGAVVASPQHPVGNAVLSRAFPDRSGTVLSWHTAGGNIGTLLVPILASLAIVRWGWRAAVIAVAVPLLLGGILIAVRMRGAESARQERIDGAVTTPLKTAMLTRTAIGIIAASTIAAGGRGLGVVNGYLPAYLKSGLHLEQLLVGVIFTVVLLGSVAGPVFSGPLADRFGRRRLVAVTYVAGAAALALFGMTGPNVLLLLVLGALVGVFAYSESPLLQALFSDAIRGAPQQAAFGLYFAISYGGGALWVAVLGWTIDHLGFTASFWIMAASFLLATATLYLAPDRVPPARPEAQPG
jgi:MFS family permease